MNYFLFLDESGNHGLTSINNDSNVFLLCGVLLNSDDYELFRQSVNEVKRAFWGTKNVIFHSRDIRKCQKEFSILLDLEVKRKFYSNLNECISLSNFTIFSSAIKKEEYIKRHGLLSNDVYELSLSFIIERTVFFLDNFKGQKSKLDIIIEQRGKKEDNKLREHFQRLMSRGTGYVKPERLATYNISIHFRSKKSNINGLQLSDLIAYPLATYVNDPKRANPVFDLLCPKIYSGGGKQYGFKVYPK